MHGPLPIFAYKQNGSQIESPGNQATHTKLGYAIFPGMMLYYFLANFFKPGPFGDQWDIPVHLTIYFNTFYNPVLVGFQPTVKIMQFNFRYLGSYPIKKTRRHCFGKRIMAKLFPSAHQVISIIGDHLIKSGDLIGTILQIGVHRNNNVSLAGSEALIQSGGLTIIPLETD